VEADCLVIEIANNPHALDGGIALLFLIAHHWPAASDVIR
jgi:hypothetical protein